MQELTPQLPQARLRADVNAAWNRQQTDDFLTACGDAPWDYLEQPCANLADLAWLRQQHQVAIAADESIRDPDDLEQVIAQQAADVVVLKPMLLGSLFEAQSLGRRALAAGLRVVFTSTLDGGVARAAVAHLIASLGLENEYHGLATGHLLAQDKPILRTGINRLELAGPGLGPEASA